MNKRQIPILATNEQCCGCAACVSVCPKSCIRLVEDNEGFLQPVIDNQKCIGCKKCVSSCPVLNTKFADESESTFAYAMINKDEEIRSQSSSGGVFYNLAKWVIEQNGVVFGARFDEKWEVVHDYSETLEGIKLFMGSKYVQSRVEGVYEKVKSFLCQNRIVLFSGTPCQLAGLRSYLGKSYNNLIQVDLICHGTPSPKVWRDFLTEYYGHIEIHNISFRDKTNGWEGFQFSVTTSEYIKRTNQLKHPYFKGFLCNAFLRRSCYNCKFRQYHRLTDITLADYWGVQWLCRDMFDNKGTSIVFIHTELGRGIMGSINSEFKIIEQSKEFAIQANRGMCENEPVPWQRNWFYHVYSLFGSFRIAMILIANDKPLSRVWKKIVRTFKSLRKND